VACENFETPNACLATIFSGKAQTPLHGGCSPHLQHPSSIYQRGFYVSNASRTPLHIASQVTSPALPVRQHSRLTRHNKTAHLRYSYSYDMDKCACKHAHPYDGAMHPAHRVAAPTFRRRSTRSTHLQLTAPTIGQEPHSPVSDREARTTVRLSRSRHDSAPRDQQHLTLQQHRTTHVRATRLYLSAALRPSSSFDVSSVGFFAR
jgi:hypothetical protein